MNTKMKTINLILLGLVSLLFLSQTAEARLDDPLKWKMQMWQFVVIVQAGERMTNSDKIYVNKKIINILRGQKKDLPEFENWQFNDLEAGHYYLLTYFNYKVPGQGARWGDRFNVEKSNDTFVIKAVQNDQTRGFYDTDAIYSDLLLPDFEKLLAEVPYEPNPTNTFFYKAGHSEKLNAQQPSQIFYKPLTRA